MEIRGLHEKLIEAHLNKDAKFLAGDVSPDFFSVGNGEIRQPSQEELLRQFEDYLASTEFSEYRNLREPMVGISADGTLAWALVNVRVAGVRKGEQGDSRKIDFDCAWITIYERHGGKWIRRGEVSSFR